MDVLILGILFVFVFAPAFGSARFAARSAPNGRHARMLRVPLGRGSALSAFNLAVLVYVAWWTHEDRHYDDFAAGTTILLAVTSASVLFLGLGPLISWLLGVLVRRTVRLPPLMRLAVRDLADNRARSAAAVAMTMVLTAMAVIVTTVAVAMAAQDGARYLPQGRPGALLVEVYSVEEAAAVRAAVQRELPGVPMVRSFRAGAWHFIPDVEKVDLPDLEAVSPAGVIGEGELLRYLTGDPATPYDGNTAVVVTSDDVRADTVTISYGPLETDALSSRSVPAIVVRPTDPEVKELFIPAKVIRDLGYQPRLDKLIIDPSVHRTSRAEQERIDRRLDDTATTYVERGFEASTGWYPIVAVVIVTALGVALSVTGRGGPRTTRVLLRLGGGSAAAPRLFAACRAGIGTACGAAAGTVAGCVVGLLLAWPFTAPIEWEPVPRVSFGTPWLSIAALPPVLSLLAALIAALAPVPSKEGASGRRLFGNRNVMAG
ncbi:hypothetical protein ACFYY8_29105 [Streptosporangium sp. NPDC001559]|uniref:hypothetical protein n=1 Tax=Streptosporangium sp. NPDC001559 TaxID=3366187 RepID=UPI0036EF70FE